MRRLLLTLVLALTGIFAAGSARRRRLLAPRGAAEHHRHAEYDAVLTAEPGQWSPAATSYAYQWLRDGQPIARATAQTYRSRPRTTWATRSASR